MANRLSYSQARLHSECGQKYVYYYKHKLREKVKSGALVLGSAIDEALNHLLKSKNLSESLKLFNEKLSETDINSKKVNVKESEQIVYSDYDFDIEILTPAIIDELSNLSADIEADIKKAVAMKKHIGLQMLPRDLRHLFSLASFYSIKRKGELMLYAFNEEILPKIKRVVEVQKVIKLDNGEDSLIGYADFVCEWEDGSIILFDNKTAGAEYDIDSVKLSQQLSIYAEACSQEGLKIDKFGYIVLLKKVEKNRTKVCKECGNDGSGKRHKSCDNESNGKRCNGEWAETINPKVRIQIVIDEIPERTREIVLENLDNINHAISNNVVTRNFGSCKTNYGYCPYFNLCFHNSKEGLDQLE